MTSEKLASLSDRLEGSLEEVPFGAVLLAHSLAQRSIALEIRHCNVHKTVLIDQGIPVACRTNLVGETFGDFLVSEGRISPYQCKDSFAEAVERGVRIGVVLVERGFLDPLDLPGALQRNLGRRLLECFTWQKGAYRVLAELPETNTTSRINVARLVFTGLSRYTAVDQMLAHVGPLLNRPLALHPQPPVPANELKLSRPLRDLLVRLRKENSARQLMRQSTIPKDELVRTLAALATMGVVVIRRAFTDDDAARDDVEVELEDMSNCVDRADSGDRFGERELTADEAFRLRNEITVEHMVLARKSAYEVLGVAAETSTVEVRRRYIELVEYYAPARYVSESMQAVAPMADDLLRATVNAYREITDPPQGVSGSVPTEAEVARRSEPSTFDDTNTEARALEAPAPAAPEPPLAPEGLDSELARLSTVEGPDPRFRSAEIAFSLDDQPKARDEFLRGCAQWAESGNVAE